MIHIQHQEARCDSGLRAVQHHRRIRYISQEIPARRGRRRSGNRPDQQLTAWGLSFTGVMDAIEKGPQSHAKGQTDAPWVPAWALLRIFAGLVLMAVGWLLNDPVSHLIYGVIHA